MTSISEISAWMERFAPKRLGASWDNLGLLLGDPASLIGRLMTCLTVSAETAREAIDEGAGLIVSHHPILFRPVQQIRADREDSAVVWSLAKAGIGVYSAHTAFDNTEGGINDGLAIRLGLSDVRPLRKGEGGSVFKVAVYATRSDRDAVLEAAFRAGAGRLGKYGECSFSSVGIGTFTGDEDTNPTIGTPGIRERVREWKVEFLCPGDRLGAVLASVRSAHSYEEPAIDVLPMHGMPAGPGEGRVGSLDGAIPLGEFAERVRSALKIPAVQVVGDRDRPLRKVAVACGAAEEFLKDADRVGADVLVTGEARYHRAIEARSRGVAMILAGHHATERPGVEDLAELLRRAFPNLKVWPSRRETDPLWWSSGDPGSTP